MMIRNYKDILKRMKYVKKKLMKPKKECIGSLRHSFWNEKRMKKE
jgi:hypothetical protein